MAEAGRELIGLGLFSRKRVKRVSVGTYRTPEAGPAPSIESLVDEGLLIVESGVRLAVKNQAILWALRDHADFDHLQYLEAVRERLVAAAAEGAEDADRIADELARPAPGARGGVRYEDTDEPGRLERRLDVLFGLVERLHSLLDDESYLAGLALAARDAAWEEIGAAVVESASRVAAGAPDLSWDERHQAFALLRFDLEELDAQARRDAYGSVG